MVSFTAKRSHQNLKTTLPKTTTLLTSTHAAPIDKMSLQALITVSKEIFPCLKNTNTVEKFVQVLQYLCIWWIHGKKNNVFFHLNHSKHQFIGKFFIILLVMTRAYLRVFSLHPEWAKYDNYPCCISWISLPATLLLFVPSLVLQLSPFARPKLSTPIQLLSPRSTTIDRFKGHAIKRIFFSN